MNIWLKSSKYDTDLNPNLSFHASHTWHIWYFSVSTFNFWVPKTVYNVITCTSIDIFSKNCENINPRISKKIYRPQAKSIVEFQKLLWSISRSPSYSFNMISEGMPPVTTAETRFHHFFLILKKITSIFCFKARGKIVFTLAWLAWFWQRWMRTHCARQFWH